MVVAPFITYEQAGIAAEGFLNKYRASRELPIPIEEIADVKMGMHIVSLNNLYKDHGINGFLSKDMTTIFVDSVQYNVYQQKYRFTLAHEIGHIVLHGECISAVTWNSTDEYVEARMGMDAEEIDWFETQSSWFAEQVLVPRVKLLEVAGEMSERYRGKLPRMPVEFEVIAESMSTKIARPFDVAPKVVEYRMNRKDVKQEMGKILMKVIE